METNREILKLKFNLDALQEENADINKKLNNEIQKNKMLENQLTQKLVEIGTLKSEIIQLENKVSTDLKDEKYADMQKLFNTKIESLEQIIEQSDKENQKLMLERDKERAEVKILKEQCKIWLEKFTETDQNLQIITDKYNEQQLFNEQLQTHCAELKLLLEELKPNSNDENSHTESFEIQFSENLAQSVIDMQLKEIQKENELLNRSILEKTTLTEKLQTENKKINLNYKKNSQELDCEKMANKKLLEENSKLIIALDTVKYKQKKEREDFVGILKKEIEDANIEVNKKLEEQKKEYERQLEKMKENLLNMYREEVARERIKLKNKSEKMDYQKTIEDLRRELFEATRKIHSLETKFDNREFVRGTELVESNIQPSKESIRSICSSRESIKDRESTRGSATPLQGLTKALQGVACSKADQEIPATLPCASKIVLEETFSRKTSLTIEMQDEDIDFNNKYLNDLQTGTCKTGNIGQGIRVSELALRNKMVPPHLKSSYPVEMQFVPSPHFKEEDMKAGNIDIDDSLSKPLSKDRACHKKNVGATSYKNPGPTALSKNGGKLLLQSNKVISTSQRTQCKNNKKGD